MTQQKTPIERAQDLWEQARQEAAMRFGPLIAHKPWDQLSPESQQVLVIIVTKRAMRGPK